MSANKGNGNLPAGVLTLVLGICLIITILVSSLIMLGYYYRMEHVRYDTMRQLRDNLYSAQTYVQAYASSMSYSQKTSLDLWEKGIDSVHIGKQFWGLWDIFDVVAVKGQQSDTLLFSLGFLPDTLGQSVLYVADDRRPISIAGESRIVGTAYLPLSGIKSTYINQEGYSGDKLVYGDSKVSGAEMPPIQTARLPLLEQALRGEMEVLFPFMDSLSSSWRVYGRFGVEKGLGSMLVSGEVKHQVYWSDTLLQVSSGTRLTNCLLIAPKVEVFSDVKGDFQILASEGVYIEEDVEMKYPSGIVVLSQSDSSAIKIERASIFGAIILYGPGKELRNKEIHIEEGSLIKGLVFCDGMLDLQANVQGHVSTRKFYLKLRSSIFENHLYNIQLRQDLPKAYLLSDFVGASDKAYVLKYLYK
ncbi:hypothetical protein QWY31_16385 [Cytophagales bacterium LB-30]|uniref:BTB domain-containing protein n=1 Tax=Shiella aurantiaca TaxID=3058365 RepID=A0ABT8F9L4_9BACT|nr:hypothetical protein [Shiella aurantiaca]MDN4167090.1 hypothetical protein [Shiella aurantiaca]